MALALHLPSIAQHCFVHRDYCEIALFLLFHKRQLLSHSEFTFSCNLFAIFVQTNAKIGSIEPQSRKKQSIHFKDKRKRTSDNFHHPSDIHSPLQTNNCLPFTTLAEKKYSVCTLSFTPKIIYHYTLLLVLINDSIAVCLQFMSLKVNSWNFNT